MFLMGKPNSPQNIINVLLKDTVQPLKNKAGTVKLEDMMCHWLITLWCEILSVLISFSVQIF